MHLLKVLVCLSALLFAPIAFSQQITGSIRGTVTDPSGAVIEGATVSAKQNETGLTRTTTTDRAGALTSAYPTATSVRRRSIRSRQLCRRAWSNWHSSFCSDCKIQRHRQSERKSAPHASGNRYIPRRIETLLRGPNTRHRVARIQSFYRSLETK